MNYGKWSRALAARLASSGLSCKQLGEEPFVGAMYEKLIWICAFMAVGAAHPGATAGPPLTVCS